MKDCHHDAAAAIRSLTEQLEALQHDIERHVQIAADLATRLNAERKAREEVERELANEKQNWITLHEQFEAHKTQGDIKCT